MADENTIFVSYAHHDEHWKDELLVQLRALGRAVPLDIWDDRRIRQGDDWYAEIKKAMARARIAVCLISGHFLGSAFCIDEEVPDLLRRRQEDGLLLLPILIEDCPWEAHLWLKPLQMLPRDGKTVKVDYRDNHETVFCAVAKRINEAIRAPAAPSAPAIASAAVGSRTPRDTCRLPRPESHLLGRHDKLQILLDALDTGTPRLVVFHGWGGVGKSTLVRAWVDSLPQYASALDRPLFAWSFGNQADCDRETSADSFAIAALHFFGDGSPAQGLPWEKGERLAGLIAGVRGIVVLDGLEPLQYQDETLRGTLRDPTILSLLRQLTRMEKGLCVVTSRLALADFAEATDRSAVQQHDVEEIPASLGRALLRSRGIEGTDQELESLVTDFGGQALAIDLLASYFRIRRNLVPPPRPSAIGNRNDHARRVLAGLASEYGEGAEVGLLRTLALFDGPVAMSELDAILEPPALAGATEYLDGARGTLLFQLIQKLKRERLLTLAEQPTAVIDLHPIVRQYFADDWSRRDHSSFLAGHRRLYHYYRALVPAAPRSADDVEQLVRAIGQGLQAGLHEDAYEQFLRAVAQRGATLLPAEQGLIGLELSALAGFFAQRWSRVVDELSPAARRDLLGRAAECLQALGRVAEAEEPLLQCLARGDDGASNEDTAETAQSLSTIYLVLGDLPRARHFSQLSVTQFVSQCPDPRAVHILCRHGDILQLMGETEEAEATLRRGEKLHAQIDPGHPALRGVDSFWRCDLLLAQAQQSLLASGHPSGTIDERILARLEEVHGRAKAAIAMDLDDAFALALHQICIGRAAMLQALCSRRYRLADAVEPLDRGVNGLRRSGRQHWLPRGLLARAALRREMGLLPEAAVDIREAREIAERRHITPMRLHIADCLVEQARVDLARGNIAPAVDACREARTLVSEMRYRSRDIVLTAIEAALP